MNTKRWCCPYCGEVYYLPKLVDFNDMNKCCRYWMGKEAFNLYRQKDNASRAWEWRIVEF